MEGVIVHFRGSYKLKTPSHMIVHVDSVDSRDKAAKLVGKSVVWKSIAGKAINGKIAKEHGNSGALRVIFERGMPGQSIGEKVLIN